jgi:3-oxo-5-alpha-steroid 4-dehydrogenase 1
MMERSHFDQLVIIWILLACAVFLVLLKIAAPYGRHTSQKWGITISNRWGWVFMELPALLPFLYFVISGTGEKNAVVWTIVMLYSLHYVNRSMVYPFRIKTRNKRMPLAIVIMAVCFNTMNGFVNGYYLGTLQHQYHSDWFRNPVFIIGSMLFIAGMGINMAADNKLIHLRKSSTNGYQIPYGVLFRRISCPNFFGEIIEWGGFALLCWSLPAFSFFVWTLCNLIPRALDHHRWYRKKFPDYPAERKAVLPFVL